VTRVRFEGGPIPGWQDVPVPPRDSYVAVVPAEPAWRSCGDPDPVPATTEAPTVGQYLRTGETARRLPHGEPVPVYRWEGPAERPSPR